MLTQQSWRNPTLPLAVYREIAAHLEQVDGVTVALTWDQDPTFDYLRSQIGCLQVQLTPTHSATTQQVQAILDYYRDRFGGWEQIA